MKTKLFTLIAMTSLVTLPACSKAETPKAAAPTQATAAVQALKVTHVDARQASALIDAQPSLIVLDVRTPGEFTSGHIDGAMNIDFKNSNFSTQLSALDKDQTYLIHCRSGGRSTASLKAFKKLGFKHIIHMDGGINGWNKAKLPTVK